MVFSLLVDRARTTLTEIGVPTSRNGNGLPSEKITRMSKHNRENPKAGLSLHLSRENGDAWSHFTHDHARSRAYRWGEDGIAGICDSHGLQNIAFSFWNEKESVLGSNDFFRPISD